MGSGSHSHGGAEGGGTAQRGARGCPCVGWCLAQLGRWHLEMPLHVFSALGTYGVELLGMPWHFVRESAHFSPAPTLPTASSSSADVPETHAAYLKGFVTLHSGCQALTSSKHAPVSCLGKDQSTLNLLITQLLRCLLAFLLLLCAPRAAPWLPLIPHPALPVPGSSPAFYLACLPVPALPDPLRAER